MISRRAIFIFLGCAIGLGVFFARLKNSDLSVPTHVAASSHQTDLQSGSDGWLAKVGDETITTKDVEWETALHTTVPKFIDDEPQREVTRPRSSADQVEEKETPSSSESLKQRLLVTMIERKLLYQWIKNHSEGFDHDNPSRYLTCLSETKELTENVSQFFSSADSRQRLKTRLCERSLIDQYLSEKVLGPLKVTEAEIDSYYRNHREEFKQPQRIVFRQILLPKESLAEEIRAKVNRSNFADLAKKHSIAPEAQDGGRIGPFRRDQLPTFFDIVFNMQIGEISGIVRSSYGFHIVMPLEKLPATNLTLGEARAGILKRLEATKKSELYQGWLTTAMNTIPVRSNSGEENQ